MIEKLHEVAEKEIARRVQYLKKHIKNWTCSIYANLGEEETDHLGTGTVVSWDSNTYWLLTAAHLLEQGRKATDFFALSSDGKKIVSLSRRFVKMPDNQDIALCALNSREIEELRVVPLEGKDFFNLPPITQGRGVCTIGWPNSKNKFDRYGRDKRAQMIVSGPVVTAIDLNKEKEIDHRFVFQRYSPADAINAEHVRTTSPPLVGLSGGITFDLGNVLDFDSLGEGKNFDAHPVGICIKYEPYEKVIYSTRPWKLINHVIEEGVILEC